MRLTRFGPSTRSEAHRLLRTGRRTSRTSMVGHQAASRVSAKPGQQGRSCCRCVAATSSPAPTRRNTAAAGHPRTALTTLPTPQAAPGSAGRSPARDARPGAATESQRSRPRMARERWAQRARATSAGHDRPFGRGPLGARDSAPAAEPSPRPRSNASAGGNHVPGATARSGPPCRSLPRSPATSAASRLWSTL